MTSTFTTFTTFVPRDDAGKFEIYLFGTPEISLIPDDLETVFERGRTTITEHVRTKFPTATCWTSNAQRWDSDFLFDINLTVRFPDGGEDELDLYGTEAEYVLHDLSTLRPLAKDAQMSGNL